jgi:peroxiredoxin Q/BCP
MTALRPGDAAPDFDLDTDSGGRFRLSAHRGRPVVLFFYPEDDTEGCTIENIEFSQLAAQFDALGIPVLGISPNSVESHCSFRDKYELKVQLAADTDRAVIEAYGLWGPKKLYGREYDGLHRTTFLIDGDGRIASVWGVRRIKGHAQAALDGARALVGHE